MEILIFPEGYGYMYKMFSVISALYLHGMQCAFCFMVMTVQKVCDIESPREQVCPQLRTTLV
jgi:hypothetical protein